MSTKVFSDGCRIVITEYEFREIDESGDCVYVHHFETPKAALEFANEHVANGGVAAVVEKHISRSPAHLFNEPQTYITLACLGNASALEYALAYPAALAKNAGFIEEVKEVIAKAKGSL